VAGELARGGMGVVLQASDPDLGRDLAVKLLQDRHRDDPDLARRFVEEAQIGGQLQHPGVVPVYEVGRLGGLPYFTMKLVRGRTLAALLAGRKAPAEDLPHFLKVFEQVCQAVAYAHARGVVHRDLKPHNVMVGDFGEVQVMDWGLAKVLRGGGEGTGAGDQSTRCVPPSSDPRPPTSHTERGQVLGTPAYMPPEQARGEVDRLDERCDVFGLGAILCEILTGKPPYTGGRADELHARAARGDLADAVARLGGCGADPELLGLARACLAAEPADRPRDAGVVAAAVTGYLASVQERLRAAELARAAAQARAEQQRKLAAQERRTRRLTVALAGSVLLLLLAGAGGWRWYEHHQEALKRDEDERVAGAGRDAGEDLGKARALLVVGDPTQLPTALALVRQAQGRLEGAPGNDELRREGRDLATGLEQRLRQLRQQERDRHMARLLEEARLEQAAVKDGHFDATTAGPKYRRAFREYGIDVDRLAPAEAAARVRASALRPLLAAALDDWARLEDDRALKRRLLGIARRADAGDPLRDQVRAALADRDPAALADLARRADADRLPAATAHLLASALRGAGAADEAIALLRRAQRKHPADFWINHSLAMSLGDARPPRPAEAVPYYRAALALRPDSPGVHVNLGAALSEVGLQEEALETFDRAIALQEKYAEAYVSRAAVLLKLNRLEEGLADCHKGLALRPGMSEAHNNIGAVLAKQGKLDEAIKEFRKAVRTRRPYAGAWCNLGTALLDKGQTEEGMEALAEAVRINPYFAYVYANLASSRFKKGDVDTALPLFRKAAELSKDDPEAHHNLGLALSKKGMREEAVASFREAIRLKEDYAEAHTYLGRELERLGLLDEAIEANLTALGLKPGYAITHNHLGTAAAKKGFADKALACFRRAVELDEKYVDAWCNLGKALLSRGQVEAALQACRKAVALDPKYAQAHNNLGIALRRTGDLAGAEAAYREAIRLAPDDYQAHSNLGALLCDDRGDYDGAIAAFTRALEVNRNHPLLHCNLGNAYSHKGEYDRAIRAYREAIRRRPDFVDAHYNLAITLGLQGSLDEAIAAYRKTVELAPDHALAHCYLGLRLRQRGRFAEAVAAVRRGHELGSARPGWRYPSAEWVRRCERAAELDRRLPAVLAGKDRAAGPGEAAELAEVCTCKRAYAAAARLYAEAFAGEPALLEARRPRHRYNAACVAALAAAGQGEDAGKLNDAERAELRGRALGWLRADLDSLSKRQQKADEPAKAALRRELGHWKRDPDLAGVRDVEGLPRAGRPAWRRLWADVDGLLAAASK
jgi:serine/threonine-protein kinase